MAIGDGIRRNIATVSAQERERFRDAIIALHQQRFFPGDRSDFPAGHVSYWFKEVCNRFEAMLREVDSGLSLHYWDWNTDPDPLFTATSMGKANGDAGDPWLGAGLYKPDVVGDNFRDNFVHALNRNPPGYPLHANPADPPKP